MKRTYDKGQRDLSYDPGDYVWLRLQHYRQLSLTASKHHKLSPKFYGPFQILDRIASVAYRLKLLLYAKVHDVFHFSLLKPFHGDSPMLHIPLPPLEDGRVLSTPVHVLQACRVHGAWEILVHWAETNSVEASWERFDTFHGLYPNFELEDKLFLHEG
ncbi:uncharacterized protein [Aristolochia californica]|uniref:uncharacterized protein n=1 Tax=Aristolochia californica TaxID=171875 RepID=UPI0035D5946F